MTVHRLRATIALSALAAGLLTLAATPLRAAAAQGDDGAPTVAVTQIEGAITPVVADHLADTVAGSGRAGHAALVVRLDTPGGLVTSMREIVQTFLNAPLPVVVYVAPQGADAGSAGTFITLAAHVAAMAPATTIGAATPVDLEGGEVGDKVVENAAAYARTIAERRDRDVEFAVDSVRDGRSVTADEALDIGAVDAIARTLDALLADIDGLTVEVQGRQVTLQTAGARTVTAELSWTRRFLQRVADPNLAFLFISLGTLAIIYELANPGLGAGGILGAVLLILAFFSLSVLPVNLAGLLLLVLAAGLFVAELFAPGIGVGAAGGTVALLLAGVLLFPRPTGIGVDPWVLLPTGMVLFGMVLLAGRMVTRSASRPTLDVADEVLDRTTVVRGVEQGRPRVTIDGTTWRVRADPDGVAPLRDGDRVRIVDRDNLDLVVAPASSSEDARSSAQDPPADH